MNSLINHKLKAICIQIPKNASSYLKELLCNHYGFESIEISRNDFYYFCENKNTNLDCFYKDSHNEPSVQVHYLRAKGIVRYYETMFDNEKLINKPIKPTYINKEIWQSYYKFSFTRNPKSRFISSYNFFKQNKKKYKSFIFKSIEDLINIYNNNPELISDLIFSHTFITQYDHLVSNNYYINLDYIGKIETIEIDLQNIFKILNIEVKDIEVNDIIYKNETIKNNFDNILLTKNVLDFINNYFKKDFKTFGYSIEL
jgi:hypothetical protein